MFQNHTLRSWIVLILAACIVVPVSVNFIVLQECPFGKAAGDESAWISFWGTFAGSSISALVSFCILMFTIKDNKRRESIELKQKEVDFLRKDLAQRISDIRYDKLRQLIAYYKTFNPEYESKRLLDLRTQIHTWKISGDFVYGYSANNKDIHYISFWSKYRDCLDDYNKKTESLLDIINNYTDYCSHPIPEGFFVSFTNEFNNYISGLNESNLFTELTEEARNLYFYEVNCLKQM